MHQRGRKKGTNKETDPLLDRLGQLSDGVREAHLLPFRPEILLNPAPLQEAEGGLDPLLPLQLMVAHFRHLQEEVQSQLHQGRPNKGMNYPLWICGKAQ